MDRMAKRCETRARTDNKQAFNPDDMPLEIAAVISTGTKINNWDYSAREIIEMRFPGLMLCHHVSIDNSDNVRT